MDVNPEKRAQMLDPTTLLRAERGDGRPGSGRQLSSRRTSLVRALIPLLLVFGASRPASAATLHLKLIQFSVSPSSEATFLELPNEVVKAGGWAGVSDPEKVPLRIAPNGTDQARIIVSVVDSAGKPVAGVDVTFVVDAVAPKATEFPRDRKLLLTALTKSLGTTSEKAEKVLQKRLGEQLGSKARWHRFGRMMSKTVKSGASGLVVNTFFGSTVTAGNKEGEEKIRITATDASPLTLTVLTGVKLVAVSDAGWKVLRFKSTANQFASPYVKTFLDNLDARLDSGNWLKGPPKRARLTVTDLSAEYGGILLPHVGHLTGNCIDMRPVPEAATEDQPVDTGQRSTTCDTSANPKNYDKDAQMLLFDILSSAGIGARILFLDPCRPHWAVAQYLGHYNHMHISWEPISWIFAFATEDDLMD